MTTSVGLATVAQAVSGSVTSTSLVTGANAQETGAASGNGNGNGNSNDANPTAQQGAAGRNEAVSVKVTAVLLGGVVAVAGML